MTETRCCPATTGNDRRIRGQMDFRCELPDDGHVWHERQSPPLAARWRDKPEGGRLYEYARSLPTKPAA